MLPANNLIQFMLFLLCRKCHPFSSLSPYVLADTVKPRFELAGADCEKILVIDESDKSLSMADERLEEALAKTGAKVLILDPIQAYLGGGMDMNRANEARDMTKKLGALAEKYQCAILLIGHMNKASGNKAAYERNGSPCDTSK